MAGGAEVLAGSGRSAHGQGLIVPDSIGGFGLGSYFLGAYLAAAMVLLVVLVGASVIFGANEARLMERHLRAYSGTVAQEMGERTAAVRSQLKRWRTDPGLQAALLNGRSQVLRDKEEELKLLVPGALDVLVFTEEDAAQGGAAARRLSFAGLDMVQQVQAKGRVSLLEAHRVHRDDEHLAVAGPVIDARGGAVLGVVHIMLPLTLLPHRAPESGAQSWLIFRQRVDDSLVAVEPADAPEAPAGAPSVQLPIADTRLELYAWAESSGVFGSGLLAMLVGLYALALVLLAAALGLPYRSLQRGVKADLASMVALAEDAAARRPLRGTRGCVREVVAAMGLLRRPLRELASGHPAVAPASADLAGAPAAEVPPEPELPHLDAGLDTELEGLAAAADSPLPAPPAGGHDGAAAGGQPAVPAHIFRAYDIRGLVDTDLDAKLLRLLGRAVGSEAAVQGQHLCVVARDQRPSGPGFAEALMDGLADSGCDVVDLGIAPTPLAYFAAHVRGAVSAAIVTASHNPSDYNGLKVVLGGRPADQDQLQGLRQRILRSDFGHGEGRRTQLEPTGDYIRAVCDDISLARPMSLVVDCGFATASGLAPALFRALECEVTELDCDMDAEQAARRSLDPSQPKNLYGLGDAVIGAGADLGLAFDADGDRLGVVDSVGKFIAADRLLMLLAADILARAPGSDIVYDVKCSHHLGSAVLQHGGRAVMCKSGHSFIKAKVRELGAPLGGELSGHIVFAERWNGFDDAFYAAARLLEVLALDPRPSTDIFADFAAGIGTPELFVPLATGEETTIMQAVMGMAERLDGVNVNTIDGLRAEFDRGWGLVRASNTQPGLVFRFEADDQVALDKIQDLFRRMMHLVAPSLEVPF